MSQNPKKATRNNRAMRQKAADAARTRRLTISYREAARLVGRSKSHIHAVCTGERISRELESRLRPYFAS